MSAQKKLTQEEEMIQKASTGSPQDIVTTKKLAECAVALGTAFLSGDGKPFSGERIKEVTKPVGWSPAMGLNLRRIGFLTEDGTVCVDKVVRVLDGPNLVQYWPVPDGANTLPAADLPPAVPDASATIPAAKPKSPRSAPDFVSSASVDLLRRFDERYHREIFLGGEAHREVASDSLEPTFYDRVRQLTAVGSIEEVSGGWRTGKTGPKQYRVTDVAATDRKGTTYVPVAPVADPEALADDVAAPVAEPTERYVVLRRVPAPSPVATVVQADPVEPTVTKPTRTVRPKESIASEIETIKSKGQARDAWERELTALMDRRPPEPTGADAARLVVLKQAYDIYDVIVVDETIQG